MNKYLVKSAASVFLAAASVASPAIADAMDVNLSVDIGANFVKGQKVESSVLKDTTEFAMGFMGGVSAEMYVTDAISAGVSLSTGALIPTSVDLDVKSSIDNSTNEMRYFSAASLDSDKFTATHKDKSPEDLLKLLTSASNISVTRDSSGNDVVDISGMGKFSLDKLLDKKDTKVSETHTQALETAQGALSELAEKIDTKKLEEMNKSYKDALGSDDYFKNGIESFRVSMSEAFEDVTDLNEIDWTEIEAAITRNNRASRRNPNPLLSMELDQIKSLCKRAVAIQDFEEYKDKNKSNYNEYEAAVQALDLAEAQIVKEKLEVVKKHLKDTEMIKKKASSVPKKASESVKLSTTCLASIAPFVKFTFFDVDGISVFGKVAPVVSFNKYSITEYKNTTDNDSKETTKVLDEESTRTSGLVSTLGAEITLGASYKVSDAVHIGVSVSAGHKDALFVYGLEKDKKSIQLKNKDDSNMESLSVKKDFMDGVHIGASLSAGITL